MKKLFLIISVLATGLFLVSCSKKERLVVFMPNDYIDKSIIKRFEKQEGVKVDLLNFNSNEVMLGQVESNKYDVIVPSDYAIEELANKDLIDKINYKDYLGEGFEFTETLQHFMEQLSEEGFNFLDYSVPYFWGSIGVLYNHNKFTAEEIEAGGFGVINKKGQNNVIYDSSRDALMAGLLQVNGGVLLNDATQADVNLAKDWLIDTKKNGARIISDEILGELVGNRTKYDAVIAYSGDAAYIMSENDNYSYHLPENTNVWADGFVVTKQSTKKDLAREFIKFMTSYEQALDNTIEVGYTAARQDVYEEMVTGEGDYAEPRLKYAYEAKVENFQIFRYNDELKNMLSKAFELVKSA